MLATSPPSSAQQLPGGREQRQPTLDADTLDRNAQVELAGPLFRNEASALLLNLSLAASAKMGRPALVRRLRRRTKGLFARFVGKIAHRGRRPAHTWRRRPAR